MTQPVWAPPEDAIAGASHSDAHERFVSRPVALAGFMGVGKSSVGRELAILLNRPFVDTDVVIEQQAGISITEIFARQGEPAFRRMEGQVVREALAAADPAVIALGGGTFSQPSCAPVLLEKALVVHLYTPWSILVRALPELEADRPVIRGREPWQVQDLFLSRAASYRRAHVRVSLPRTSPHEAALSVAAVMKRQSRP